MFFDEESSLKDYYQKLHKGLEDLLALDQQSSSIKNRTKSYLVTLLKGNQHIREMPKDLKGRAARELRLLAVDRSLTESMHELTEIEKRTMNEYANKINE